MIEIGNPASALREKLAVDGLDFVVQPGIVTGFLGPNGAGKSTTMRVGFKVLRQPPYEAERRGIAPRL
jgi:ABC-type multidrug transport system ATPase subunit